MSDPKPDPLVEKNGLPYCRDECALFDGKRCRATGFRPGTLCEPAVTEALEESAALKARVAELEAAAVEYPAGVPPAPREALVSSRVLATTIEAPPPDDLLDRITPGCRHTRRLNPHGVPVTT